MIKFKSGWIPDEADSRDLMFVPFEYKELPKEVNLTYMNPDVYDQKNFGSCVFNSESSMFQGRLRKQGQDFRPSRFFNYYNYRKDYADINEDSGASMRDGIKMYVKYGVPPEPEWPYEPKNFAVEPPAEAYNHALKHQAIEYRRIDQDLTAFKSCLAAGNTFVGGIMIYESFMKSKGGIIPMPRKGEKVQGGHAIEVIGYNDKIKSFICKNSWGKTWGMHGYFLLPYDYLTNNRLATDFWTITLVEIDAP
jgi:C1A family cysteine protease